MAKVGIVMGSDSDMPVMAQRRFLEKMGIEFEMTVISAHREPDVFEYAKSAEEKGYKVIIPGPAKQPTFRVCAQPCSQCLLSVFR